MNSNDYKRPSYNLRGTKERLLEINPNYFLEKEIETPKELRNLSTNLGKVILFVDIGAFAFILLLMASFCLTKNECCTDDENVRTNLMGATCCACCLCCNGKDCNCDPSLNNMKCEGNGNPCALIMGFIILFVILIVFYVIFLIIKGCGKHGNRVCSIIILLLINITEIILSFISGTDKFCILIAVFSFIAAVCNFLGLLLPNLESCEHLS